jgi:hypothetical protein
MVLTTDEAHRIGKPTAYPARFSCFMCGGVAAAPDQPVAVTDGAKRWEQVNGEPAPN